ncbi:MAG: family 20 glycosylhydrolase [Tannerellaceae bacterium]|nr:family 20 glycosylhydrolase [Tannerellaceae bacterium]
MKNLFAVCAVSALVFLSSCGQAVEEKVYNQGVNVIPAPLSLVQHEGAFPLNQRTSFYASTPEGKTIAAFFAGKLKRATGYPFGEAAQEGANTIALLIDGSLDLKDEGYTLDVTPEGATVKAQTPQGLFYGMQTFLQLLPAEVESPVKLKGIAWEAPAVAVKDEPRFGYRGVMLDACRHFIPVEDVKKQLDVISLFKINRMHWHLTEDQGWRIEIKQYPKLTEIGSKSPNGEGFYTQEEIKEIVQYAAERFITVIPEIELPGHELAAISAYPELSCQGEPISMRQVWGVEDVVLCAGKESTFEFLENVIKEVIALFPSDYFHIGGDECPKVSWKECPLCQQRIREEGLKADAHHSAEERLQSYFVQRIEKVLTQYGKKMIGWDEILEGGLAPTATVMSWRGEQGGIAAASMDHDVIMTPGVNGMYLDAFQGDPKIEPVTIGGYTLLEKTYGYNPTPDTLVATGKAHFIKGVQANLWSEYMYTTDLLEYRAYPRVLAVSETAWSSLDRKDYKDFERRLNNALVRLDGHGINYHIPQPEQPQGSCNFVAFTDKASLEFTTTRPIKVVYTTDGTEPTPQSAVYESPLEFTESGILKIRSVLPSGRMSPTRLITVEKQELAPAWQPEGAPAIAGLNLQIAYGEFQDVTQLSGLSQWKDSTLTDLRELTRIEPSNNAMRNVKQYAAIASGYVDIPEDGVYYFSSDNEEVWIDGHLLVNNRGEVKRFSRNDQSVALAKGLHELKVVFLGHIIGGWPSNWNNGSVQIRKSDAERFSRITPEMLVRLQ